MEINGSIRKNNNAGEFWPVRKSAGMVNGGLEKKENKGLEAWGSTETVTVGGNGVRARRDVDFRRKRVNSMERKMGAGSDLKMRKEEELINSKRVDSRVKLSQGRVVKSERKMVKRTATGSMDGVRRERMINRRGAPAISYGTKTELNKKFVQTEAIDEEKKIMALRKVEGKVLARRKIEGERLGEGMVLAKKEERLPTARELKQRAVEKALAAVEKSRELENSSVMVAAMKKEKKKNKIKKVILATACALSCVAVLAYFVNMNVPDISVRVAAMQAGIDAKYPSYLPKGFKIVEVSAEKDNKVSMEFRGENGDGFTLAQSKSVWDSVTLMNNYVKQKWGNSFTRIREQGITIFLTREGAVWVNRGMMFEVTVRGRMLEPTQIKNLAVSL